MSTCGDSTVHHYARHLTQHGAPPAALRPGYLYLVGAPELHELGTALAGGKLPPDFEAKLARLAEGDLMHSILARDCRLCAALLLAARNGWFKDARPADCERLLRVLAYVRKDDDAIADYRVNGFMDDQQEMRAAMTEMHPLFKSFKAWRLRHQVPAMWLHN